MNFREVLLSHLVCDLSRLRTEKPHVLRVGIDGDAGAGKTTLCGELAEALLRETGSGCQIICASTDHFHNPRTVRYRQGKDSPDGFYQDSYDYGTLRRLLLDPLNPGGNQIYRSRAFDHRRDAADLAPALQAEPSAILIFEGLFLHRPELVGYWDYSIFLDVTVATGLARCAARGDGSADPFADSNRRYILGFQRYVRECNPKSRSSIVVDNEDAEEPRILRKWSRV